MLTGHTKEPWVAERAHDIDAIAWVGQFAVLPADHATKVARGNTEDDARRIVACVNACRGLPTDELEQKGLVAAVGNQLLEADRQRDELFRLLLEAQRYVRYRLEYTECDARIVMGLIADIDAAIAASRGEQ